jgi:hypothetical protein
MFLSRLILFLLVMLWFGWWWLWWWSFFLITMLSTVSIATVTSLWVFADVITVDKEIPSLSVVRICLFVPPSLLLSMVGLFRHRLPLKAILSRCYQVSDCQFHLIPFFISYNFILVILSIIYQIYLILFILEIFYGMWNQNHILWVTFSTDIQSLDKHDTIKYFSIRNNCGLPVVFSSFSSGKIFLISFHRSAGMRIIVLTYFLLKHY